MNATQIDEVPYERIEVRVLGSLRVRRADGTVVDPAEWRTAQTADLLRLLALHVGEPVAVDVLVEALWPNVDESRGRASLRTAASRIRKALDEDCVQRRLGGLVLTGAWVDANAFGALAQQSRRHILNGELAKAVTTTREAEALYLGEFHSHHDNTEWALRERHALAATFRTMIADAAEASATLTWWHDTIDLAERTLLAEPCSERAYRALMRGQRGLGEISLALKTYDRCRRVLGNEIGADPSAETHALYLELLADEPSILAPPEFTGRDHEQAWLRELALTCATNREPTLACLLGQAGSGKTRLVERVLPVEGSSLTSISCTADADPWPALLAGIGADVPSSEAGTVTLRDPVTVLVDDAHLLSAEAINLLADGLASLRGPVCVVLAAQPQLHDGRCERLIDALPGHASRLTLVPLGSEEVAELCATLLHGDASEALTTEVMTRTAGLPGAVVALARSWASAGRIAATSTGLVVLHGGLKDRPDDPRRQLLAQAVDHLSPAAMDVLHLIAVLGRPVTPELLLPLTSDARPPSPDDDTWLRATLGHLTDLTLLTPSEAGLAPRDPLLADLVLTWLRPSARQRLHRRVAAGAHITAAERVDHWLQAGEPQLARAASLNAVTEAFDAHEYERARQHLRRLCEASELDDAAPSDRVELFERWGDVAALLGRAHEAGTAFAEAAAIARSHDLPELARLESKGRLAVDTTHPARRAADRIGALPGQRRSTDARATIDSVVAAPDRTSPPSVRAYPGAPSDHEDLAPRLHQVVRDADERGNHNERVLARASLVRNVCIPRRQFREARSWTTQALALTDDPIMSAHVLTGAWLAGVVLGDAAAAEEVLNRTAALLNGTPPESTGPALAALQCLVAHDLGRRELAQLHTAATQQGVFEDPMGYQWVAIRIATERGDLAAAQAADHEPTPHSAEPVVRQLRGCASAALAMELGRPDQARSSLLEVLAIAEQTGSTLPVPEAVARLIVLDAHADPSHARKLFEQFEAAIGNDTWLPRENVFKLLARAALRAADGRADDAAAAAAAAADTAENAGLVLLAAQAHQHRAVHLSAAGKAHEARLAIGAAARWRGSATSAPLPQTSPMVRLLESQVPRLRALVAAQAGAAVESVAVWPDPGAGRVAPAAW